MQWNHDRSKQIQEHLTELSCHSQARNSWDHTAPSFDSVWNASEAISQLLIFIRSPVGSSALGSPHGLTDMTTNGAQHDDELGGEIFPESMADMLTSPCDVDVG